MDSQGAGSQLLRPRPIWKALALAVVAVLTGAASAQAAQPVKPDANKRFYSYDTANFVAERAPDDPDFTFVFSPDANFASTENWMALGPRSDEERYVAESVDLDWLAFKLSHLGQMYWALCPVAYVDPEDEYGDYEVLTDRCSAPSPFTIRFRHPTLTSSDARRYTRRALSDRLGSAWRFGYGKRVQCKRESRIKSNCRASWFIGDTVYYGRMSIYRKRYDTSSLVYYRLRMTRYDEYCHLVNKRPRSVCTKTIRRTGQVG